MPARPLRRAPSRFDEPHVLSKAKSVRFAQLHCLKKLGVSKLKESRRRAPGRDRLRRVLKRVCRNALAATMMPLSRPASDHLLELHHRRGLRFLREGQREPGCLHLERKGSPDLGI